jgi:hypothetical protein
MKAIVFLVLYLILIQATMVSQNLGTLYNKDNGLTEGKVLTTYSIPDKITWIGTEKGITSYNGKEFKQYPMGENGLGKSKGGFNMIFMDHSKNIWACGARINPVFISVKTVPQYFIKQKDKPTFKMEQIIFEIEGLSQFKNDKWVSYTPGKDIPKKTSCIFEDAEENMWAVSKNNGAAVYKNDKWKLFNKSNGLQLSKIEHVLADNNGYVWFVGADGVCWYKNGKFDYKKAVGKTKISNIEAIFVTNENLVWIETKSNLILFKDGDWEVFSPEEITSGELFQAFTGPDNRTWIGTDKGLLMYDGSEMTSFLKNVNIRDFKTDKDNNLWVATDKGPAVFKNGSFKTFYDFKKSIFGVKLLLINNQIWYTSVRESGVFDENKFTIFPYSEYSIKNKFINGDFRFIGTDKQGNVYTEYNTMKNAFICKYDGKSWTKLKLPNTSRMLSGSIYSTYQDDDLNFWFLTTLGIFKFDGENFKTIDENHGGPFTPRMENLRPCFDFKRQLLTGRFDGAYLLPEGIEAYDK